MKGILITYAGFKQHCIILKRLNIEYLRPVSFRAVDYILRGVVPVGRSRAESRQIQFKKDGAIRRRPQIFPPADNFRF